MKKIIDTILYYDEVLILDLRLNILNKHIDHFVILECNYDFNGAYKGYNFDIQNFIKFKDKIIYIKLDLSKEIHLVKNNGWLVHDRSRDAIINSLEFVKDEDIVIHSDADEIPNETLLKNLPTILENNPENEVYLVPRVNTVEGLTQEHINKWGWNVNDKGWVNFPDYQWRVWKNLPDIKWINKVHEVLDGHKTYSALPSDERLSIYHPKTIDKQEKQNAYYGTLQ